MDEGARMSKVKDCKVILEEGIEVKVNEFFDDNSSSAKLWTTEPSLANFLEDGPNALLGSRLGHTREPKKASPAKTKNSRISMQEV